MGWRVALEDGGTPGYGGRAGLGELGQESLVPGRGAGPPFVPGGRSLEGCRRRAAPRVRREVAGVRPAPGSALGAAPCFSRKVPGLRVDVSQGRS